MTVQSALRSYVSHRSWESEAEHPWIRRADCVPCSTPFYIRGLSICRFWFLWEVLEPIPHGNRRTAVHLFRGILCKPLKGWDRAVCEDPRGNYYMKKSQVQNSMYTIKVEANSNMLACALNIFEKDKWETIQRSDPRNWRKGDIYFCITFFYTSSLNQNFTFISITTLTPQVLDTFSSKDCNKA